MYRQFDWYVTMYYTDTQYNVYTNNNNVDTAIERA